MRQVIKNLRAQVVSAKSLRKFHLKPKLINDKRWSSALEMLLRYDQLEKHVHIINKVKIETLLLSPAAEGKVDLFFKTF